ncbi:probable serine/threonine-protein kinase MARK-A [Tetranychus urticae]|uniref:Uncharacterized protein n=1 Tax=Tetranychus urticae TaxID=32264 RepID=T1KWH0_TETUR|nr:probable serine/threonine-protein kinase MARK-A [Tetranychus urticae]XP_015791236.1 probable serine/threonine-protein kinase MARK-A [Tetranychus urticae]XP_015791237.1 probable serine/threonine-protein kinase MARK-A [Tetranychus urticae]XP_015791238.1 probable serine/threonine-protein kinase MARK-A [Tetranychus urticae]
MSSAKGQSILEKWLQDMPNSNQRSVKRERRDCDDLLASKTSSSSNLFLNQFLPSVSALPSIPSSSLSSAASSSTGPSNNGLRAQDLSKLPKKIPESVQDLSNCIDAKSIKGIFGWSTVNDIPLPVILREDQKLVPVRVVESKVIGKYRESLPWTVFSCINVRSYYITENEAKLLNEINGFHCDYHYGYRLFTSKDVVVCLSDVVTLSKFLEQSELIFNQGLSKADVDGLGFVNISGYVMLPYISKKTVCNTKNKTSTSSPPPEATTTPPPTPTNSNNNNTSTNTNNENESSDENVSGLQPSESKPEDEDDSSNLVQKYVPESLITKFFLLVKADKVDMTEWDASYLKMLYIYAGIDHCQIPPNDKLCLLSELKWDSPLCPLQIEECDPRAGQNYPPPKNYLTSSFSHRGAERVAMDLDSHLNHHLHLHSHLNPHPHAHSHTHSHSHSQPVLQPHHQTRSVFSMQNSSKQNTNNHHNNHSHSHNSHHHQTLNSSNCINHNQSWHLSSANRKISRL